MFYIMKSRYGIYPEVVVSRHRKKDIAERRLAELIEKHDQWIQSTRFFRSDGTQYYIVER